MAWATRPAYLGTRDNNLSQFPVALITERKPFQVPISVLCLLVAVVAVDLWLFLSTYRHNAQLREMTQSYNAQLGEQNERFGVQMKKMAADHNAQIAKMTAEHQKEVARWTRQVPVTEIMPKR